MQAVPDFPFFPCQASSIFVVYAVTRVAVFQWSGITEISSHRGLPYCKGISGKMLTLTQPSWTLLQKSPKCNGFSVPGYISSARSNSKDSFWHSGKSTSVCYGNISVCSIWESFSLLKEDLQEDDVSAFLEAFQCFDFCSSPTIFLPTFFSIL